MKALRVHFSSNNFGRVALAIAGFLATTPLGNAIPIEITSTSPTVWPVDFWGIPTQPGPIKWSAGAVWANDLDEIVHVEYITFGLWHNYTWPTANFLITTKKREYTTVVPPHGRASVDLPETLVPRAEFERVWGEDKPFDLILKTTVLNFAGETEDKFGIKRHFSWSVPDHGATIWLLLSTLLLLPALTMVRFLARSNVKRQA